MTNAFIICGIACTIVVGSMFGLIIVSNWSTEKKWKKNLVAIAVSTFIGFGISGLLCFESYCQQKEWNDGVCPECGVEWRFTNADRTRHGRTIYYYVCDNCGKIIEQEG